MLGLADNKANDESQLPRFEVEVNDISSIRTYVVFNPNRDVVEDRPKQKEYSRHEIAVMVSRLMVAIYKILALEELERLVFYFTYPKFSSFLLVCILIFILNFDPAYLLSYLLGLFIIWFVMRND